MKSVRRRDKRGWYLLLGIFIMVAIFSFLSSNSKKYTGTVEAVSLSSFDSGYIISDYTMGNYNAMTEAEIQAFLKSKGKCRDTRTYLADQYTNYSYHIKDGHFVCLAEEIFGEGVTYGEEVTDGESAAHIIWQAAQDYQINPQVLIVLLQKEQGLITDSWPNSRQYRSATGYGCPDTAPCNSEYYGFKNQVRKAAALFRTVLNGGWTNYPLGDNYIQYNPDASCGGSVVNVRSLATSALYRYTPYQPNEGALAAGYGTAYCGAYGNRNFYLYFEDWFGGITTDDENTQTTLGEAVKNLRGSYNIYSLLNNSRGLAYNETNAILSEKNIGWYLTYNADTDDYTIENETTKSFLSVDNGRVAAGSNVLIVSNNSTCNQRWKIYNADNYYLIKSACSDLVLDVAGGSSNNGTNIQLWTSNNTEAQKWVLDKIVTNNIVDENNEYVIISALSGNKAIDIAGGAENSKNGTNIQTWEDNGTNAQKWKLVKNNDDTYTITNPSTGRVLDVAGGSKNTGANIQLWESNGSCAQRWYIDKKDDKYTITSACSDLVLDVAGGSSNNGANIQLWSSNNTEAQKWTLKALSNNATVNTNTDTTVDVDNTNTNNDTNTNTNTSTDIDVDTNTNTNAVEPVISKDDQYVIKSALNNDKVIDIAGGAENSKNGTNIQTWEDNGTNAQKWKLVLNDDGTYTIINPLTGRVLDVAGGSKNTGANIQLWESNGSCAQRWRINKIDDNQYTFVSACSDLVLDVAGGSSNNGANIQLWSLNNTNAQKWVLEKK